MQSAITTLPLWAQVLLAVVPAVGLLLTAIGLFMNVAQSRRTNAQGRAALVASCLKGFSDDKEMQEAFYQIEYEKFEFNEEFNESPMERAIDKLLRHFANLALSWQAGLLTTADVKPIKYYLLRIMRNDGIQKYVNYLADWTSSQKISEHPYSVLAKLHNELEK